jgi:hypothetical protein
MVDTFPPSIVRPASVTTAVTLMYTAFGIGIVRSALEFPSLTEEVSVGFVVTVWLLVSAFMLFLIRSIANGRNWARITFLVLFAIGLPIAIEPLLHALQTNFVSGLLGVAQMAAQITALILLFQAASSSWFRGRQDPGKHTERVEF